mgnify:CR=1 FL=1
MKFDGPRTIDISDFRPGRPPTRLIVLGILILLALLIIVSMVFTVQPEEVGVVLRFVEPPPQEPFRREAVVDADLLDATGKTQVLSEDLAVETGIALGSR